MMGIPKRLVCFEFSPVIVVCVWNLNFRFTFAELFLLNPKFCKEKI